MITKTKPAKSIVKKKKLKANVSKKKATVAADDDVANRSLDDFLETWDDSDKEEEEKSKNIKSAGDSDETDDEEKEVEANTASGKSTGANNQKNYIKNLKNKDPEFYKFLKDEDTTLLNFDESSDEDSDKSASDGEDDQEDPVHQLPDKLEVASDESDFEDEELESKYAKKGKITKAEVEAWSAELTSSPNKKVINDVVEAFRAAVTVIGSGETGQEEPLKYRVEGGTLFNSIVRMCVVNLQPALKQYLRQEDAGDSSFKPERSKNWKKIEKSVRLYLDYLIKLFTRVTEPSVGAVVMKHVHQMIPFFQTYTKGEKLLLSRLIFCWCQGEETVRIIALMCIVRMVRGSNLLETAVKQMYLSYVKNCKFTSPSTLPHINFMRRSLVEVLGLDHNLAYYQAFIQIRQLAIHLRNAIVNPKKEGIQAVYNWQFIHSLELWGSLLCHTAGSETLQPLIFPLVQVTFGVIRLVPTAKYFPLRFHCATILSNLATAGGKFIPVMPIYLDILNNHNFNNKSKKVSMKPLEFSTILKLSKSQLSENGFKDATIDAIYSGLITYLAVNSNKIGFPELVTPLIFQLKDFLKACKSANYCKKVKQVLDKVIANQKFIETRRRTVTFSVGDKHAITVWEAQVERDGTPLLAFYKSWKKIADTQQMKKVTEQENLDDYSHIPLLKKNHKKIRMKKEQEKIEGGFLSGSDDNDDDLDDEERFKLKEDRAKPGEKRKRDLDVDSDDDSADNDDDDDDDVEGHENGKESSDDDLEDDDDGDHIEDLNLDDMDSDSELEMKDDFGSDPGSDDGDGEADGSDVEASDSE